LRLCILAEDRLDLDVAVEDVFAITARIVVEKSFLSFVAIELSLDFFGFARALLA